MPMYLVELYVDRPSAARRGELVDSARAATAGARYVRSIFLDDEQTCFHEYESSSAGELAGALASAGVAYERLIEAEVVR